MDNKNGSKFIVGLVFGTMVAVLLWYWQKSTSAEDGALALLDRLASAESRLGELRAELSKWQDRSSPHVADAGSSAPEVSADTSSLRLIHGIGPVFERRLNDAGVTSASALAAMDPLQVAEILNIGQVRAETILAEAVAAGM